MDAVYRLTLAITGNEADAGDAAQQTFIAAWRALPRLRDAARFDAWLQRVAVNEARMVIRARRRRQLREISSAAVLGPHVPAAESDGTRLQAALGALTPDQRAILALHHLDRRSVAEIAEVLQIPAGTVKSRLFHARRALDAALRAEDDR